MRTGAIFARGSCRALKWMALLGVVLALGTDQAAAQVTVTLADKTVGEGETVTLTVGGTVTLDASATGGTLTVTPTAAGGTATSTATSADATAIGAFIPATITVPPNATTNPVTGHQVSGTITWVVGTDVDAEDEVVNLTFAVAGGGAAGVSGEGTPAAINDVMIDDSHPQLFEWGPVPTLSEDGSATVTLTATPTPSSGGLRHPTTLAVDTTGYGVEITTGGTGTSHTFTNAAATITLTITAPKDDNNRTNDTIRVRALESGTLRDRNIPLSITVTDKTAPTVPDAPAAPTVTATASTQGSLDVMWMAPNANGSAIIDYGLQYRVKGAANWTVMTAAITTTSTTLTRMLAATTYEVQINARNAIGSSTWSPSGEGTTAAAPPTRALRGQVTEMKVVGASAVEKTIGGTRRVHVPEGATDVMVSMTVQWTHAEITALYGGGTTAPKQWIYLQIQGNDPGDRTHVLPDWVSWIDDEGDVDFPNSQTSPESRGRLGGFINFNVPPKPKPNEFPDSIRHSRSSTDTVRLLIHHDQDEAENDAFYVDATSSRDVDLNAGSAVNRTTPLIVIEDDEDQKVTVKKGRSSGPTEVYESDGNVSFTVAAAPPRLDLPLDVRLDMVDLSGVTVSAARISLSDTSMTLTPAANSANVTVHLPASDGDREDDDYELQASVSLYSLASGGFDAIPVASHAIKVMDVHRLPQLGVSAASDSVAEGEEVELTVTINRNPANTIAVDPEKRLYTSEPIEVMLTAGAGTTASMGDYQLPATIEFPKHNGKAPWTQSMKVKVMAMEDDDLDDGEMLVIDAMVAGTETKNGPEKDSHAGLSSLTITESTTKLVWARSADEVEAAVMAAKKAGMGDDMMFTAGEMIVLEGNDLFGSAEGVSVGYTATVDGDAVSESVSGGVVTITADSMGMAKVTITARASRPSGAVMINDQTDPREASITVTLEVGLVALSIALMGPEDMNLVEGGMGGMVTATANRAVTEDTMVALMRDRAMSSADDMDYTAEPITIMAGQMSGSTMVMAVADDLMENDGNMPEELVLYGMAADNAGEVTGEVKFYLWDAAVPALPIVAQLLLAALLGLGGYRRYRRR